MTTTPTATENGWIQGENYFRPDDLGDFWNMFGEIVTKLYNTRMVFRGVKNSSWKIASSLVRKLTTDDVPPNEAELRAAEATLLALAKEHGLGFENGRSRTETELWALLQHHGVPTRLLDVTDDPMTALYFACEETDDVDDDVDRGLQIFIVPKINEYPTLTWQSGDGITFATGWPSIQNGSAAGGKPYLVRPTNPDVRQAAQRGLFLSSAAPDPGDEKFHGTPTAAMLWTKPSRLNQMLMSFIFNPDGELLDGQLTGPPQVLQLVIRPEVRDQFRLFLSQVVGRTNSSIYPDVAGFSRHIGSFDWRAKS